MPVLDVSTSKPQVEISCHESHNLFANGIWNGNNPLDFTVPLLVFQISLMLIATRIVRLLLKPLKQPIIVSEIIGGIIIGPSILGRNEKFVSMVFPGKGYFILRNAAIIGMMYFLFLIGVKMDPSLLMKTGKKALEVSLYGVFLPFMTVLCMGMLLRKYLPEDINQGVFLVFIASSVCLTNFPVLHPILTELDLLNSQPGRLAMSSSMINDAISWVFMTSFEIIKQGATDSWKGIWYFCSLVSLMMFIVFLHRPAMLWIIKQTPEGRPVKETYIIGIMLGVLVVGFISDMIGATIVIGPLIMGLATPDGPPLGAAIVEKTESIVHGLMPLFYACIGLNINVFNIYESTTSGTFQFVLIMGYIAKLVGTLVPLLSRRMPFRNALAMGLIMNFRGQTELFTFINWRLLELINEQSLGNLVVSTMMVTAIATPFVRILYTSKKPSLPNNTRTIEHAQPNSELRVLTCVHGEENVPSIISILEASNATHENPICVYVLHLIKFVGRATPMLESYEELKKSSNTTSTDHIANAFKNYEKRKEGQVSINPFISMSPPITMHKDICAFALKKMTSLIILPFHRKMTFNLELSSVDHALRVVNPNILAEAPCSIGILVDRGLSGAMFAIANHFRIGVFFLGGADDREALAYASRMAKKSSISLNVIRILPLHDKKDNKERQLDDEYVIQFKITNARNKRVVYKEKLVEDGEEMIKIIRSIGSMYHLLLVGRRHETSLVSENLREWAEHPELGVIGDMLSSSDCEGFVSVLVMQQYTEVDVDILNDSKGPSESNLNTDYMKLVHNVS